MTAFLFACFTLCVGFHLHTCYSPAPDNEFKFLDQNRTNVSRARFEYIGQLVRINCFAIGYDVILWDRKVNGSDWKPIVFGQSSITLLNDNQTLQVFHTTEEDKGDYRCIAYNFTRNQSLTSLTSLRLTRDPPREGIVHGAPPIMCVQEDGFATSTCQGDFLDNDPMTVDITWIEIKNDNPSYINDSRITFTTRPTSVAMNMVNVNERDFGRRFMCVVSSTAKCGISSCSKSFIVTLQDCDTSSLDKSLLAGIVAGVVLLVLGIAVLALILMFCFRFYLRKLCPTAFHKIVGGTNPFLLDKEYHALIHHNGEDGAIALKLSDELTASGEYNIKVTGIADNGQQQNTSIWQSLDDSATKAATLLLIAPTIIDELEPIGENIKLIKRQRSPDTGDSAAADEHMPGSFLVEVSSLINDFFNTDINNRVTVVVPHRADVRLLPDALKGYKHVIFGDEGSSGRRACIKKLKMRIPLPG